jgi:hypothetical protein
MTSSLPSKEGPGVCCEWPGAPSGAPSYQSKFQLRDDRSAGPSLASRLHRRPGGAGGSETGGRRRCVDSLRAGAPERYDRAPPAFPEQTLTDTSRVKVMTSERLLVASIHTVASPVERQKSSVPHLVTGPPRDGFPSSPGALSAARPTPRRGVASKEGNNIDVRHS